MELGRHSRSQKRYFTRFIPSTGHYTKAPTRVWEDLESEALVLSSHPSSVLTNDLGKSFNFPTFRGFFLYFFPPVKYNLVRLLRVFVWSKERS